MFSVEDAANELRWKPWMLLVLHAATHDTCLSYNSVLFMRATSLWNGNLSPTEHSTCVSLVRHPSNAASIVLAIQSTYHRNALPLSPPDLAGTDGLWNFEVLALLVAVSSLLLTTITQVTELFISGSDGYIELEVGPGGHVLLLEFHPHPSPPCTVKRGIGQLRVTSALVIHTDTSVMEPNPVKEKKNEWVAVIELPLSILPQPPLSGNLVSIFTHLDQRVHISAVPLPGVVANFHQPSAFMPISLPQPFQADAVFVRR
jgi:hypothetical protein